MTDQKLPFYIFIDESGNFDFTSKGTKHFVLGAYATFQPAESALSLLRLKYELLNKGVDNPEFHASYDKQAVRDRVFETINKIPMFKPHVIYGNKELLVTRLRSDQGIYTLFRRAMIRFYCASIDTSVTSNVVVIFDQALTKTKQGILAGVLKPELKKLGIPFGLYFHRMSTEYNGQIADYISWSKYVSLERNEPRPWAALQLGCRPTDFNIFQNYKKVD